MTATDFLTAAAAQHPADIARITAAVKLAERAHAGQRRKSGDLYISHPLSTASRLMDWGMDVDTIIAGLLHDVPEDTAVTLDEVTAEFGPTVGFLVSGMTKIGVLKYRGVERYAENLRRMFVAMAEDVRVIIIKFADRIHNLETLKALPREKQLRIARESIEIFAPLAHRLGMGEVKGQIEDLAFQFVEPKEYDWITKLLGPRYAILDHDITAMTDRLQKAMKAARIRYIDIHGRRKHLYSLYEKLIRPENNRELNRIGDLVAIRVIVPNETACYATIGVIHQLWKPVPNRFRDYVAQPKPNGYRSLHTTVFGVNGQFVEIQVRDQQMHEEAEFGVAAHWHYTQSGKPQEGATVQPHLDWVRELSAWKQEGVDPAKFLESLKLDALQHRIFCFTPNGDVIDLPAHATVIDFAYHVHSDLGAQCIGARVNDRMTAVDTELQSGDVVEIVVNKQRKRPNPDWLDFVKTEAARTHIRRALREKMD